MNTKIINIAGWILFLISAIGFIMSSLGNFWAMFGSLFFLAGCVVFLIPYFFEWFKKVFEESSIAEAHGVWWIGATDPVTGDEKDLFL